MVLPSCLYTILLSSVGDRRRESRKIIIIAMKINKLMNIVFAKMPFSRKHLQIAIGLGKA
uniref:Uncharacterized protein n=1 Tax=Desertifilum tharense IPPAS B-1220 TaxID=1781255 RepID=A0A1E5QG29_9CYAN|nr:hypothetical protein BH720_19260 [Desertifilum tharense IPPAS B-1220]